MQSKQVVIFCRIKPFFSYQDVEGANGENLVLWNRKGQLITLNSLVFKKIHHIIIEFYRFGDVVQSEIYVLNMNKKTRRCLAQFLPTVPVLVQNRNSG